MKSRSTPKTYTLLPEETIMPDDAIVGCGYVYICDNVLRRSEWFDITIAELKRKEGYKEVRRCKLFARLDACIGDRVE